MNKNFPVLCLLFTLCNAKIKSGELNSLIEIFHNYSSTYLRYRYKNQYKVLLSEDVTLDELAIDAIAPLFERDENGRFIKLETAFKNWQPPIDTEEKAQFFINKLVAKSVEKYVSEMLRNSDPFFSKILDSITYIITKQHIIKTQILGTTYLVERVEKLKFGSLPDSKFINELPSHFFYDLNKTIPQIFNHIKDSTDKASAIPLNALVLKIKQVRSSDINLPLSTQPVIDYDIEGVIEKALRVTIKKLYSSYADKGKLNKAEVSGTEQVIRHIAFDLKDGGINPGLHKYFMEQFKGISFEEYRCKYQNTLEYLFKVLKKEIADQLDDR